MNGWCECEITVEQKETTKDATYGTDVVTWVPLVALEGSPVIGERFPAKARDMLPSRSESVRQGLETARNPTTIRIRWRDDIDSSMRVIVHRESDVTMQIVSGPAEVIGRKREIEMVCERISS